MISTIYLVGNPNVGKSVVFSRLTGVHVISSNYPGTTVNITKGFLDMAGQRIEVIDLPGTYSLEPSSKAEEVCVSLLHEKPKDETVVINIIDATNLERNLNLTLQLLEKGHNIIVCLNMCDDTVHRGVTIDVQKLEGLLGVPVISTCAVTGAGIKMLVTRLNDARIAPRDVLTHQNRWQAIGTIVEQVQHLEHRHHTLRELLEDISVRPLPGLAMAAAIVFFSFRLVRFMGESLIKNVLDPFFYTMYKPLLDQLSQRLGQHGFVHHLLIGELIKGSIDFKQSLGMLTTAPYIEFAMVLPYLISFYLILSILEDTGYLPRLAILLDNLLHRIGLHGFSIIPVLLGFGCNVPGILATRSLESKRERFIACTLISIGVPCVPLQAMIFGLLGAFSGYYVTGVYMVLFAVVLMLGLILNRILQGSSPELMLEIPPYRFPPLALLAKKMYYRIKSFLMEAIPIVLIGVLAINILLYFRLFDVVTRFTAPVISGLFGLPKESIIALVIGFFRKDVAVGMLVPLAMTAKQLFIAATLLALSFPCIATFIVLMKELGVKDTVKSASIMIMVSIVMGTLLNLAIR